jgi:hypothetical protein
VSYCGLYWLVCLIADNVDVGVDGAAGRSAEAPERSVHELSGEPEFGPLVSLVSSSVGRIQSRPRRMLQLRHLRSHALL